MSGDSQPTQDLVAAPCPRVVMGLLFDDNGLILIALRNQRKMYGGLWEFPGGKVEPDETVEEALIREILEELDAPIVIHRVFPAYLFTCGTLRAEFIPISGSITPARIRLLEHDDYRFVTIDALSGYPFSPYDDTAIAMLRNGLA